MRKLSTPLSGRLLCALGWSIVAYVCASKFSPASDLPAGLVVKGNFYCAEGPVTNLAQDKNFRRISFMCYAASTSPKFSKLLEKVPLEKNL
jgi:hypothetical protein